MERNTVTTLGELRVGDRFRWNLKRVDVWQVTAHFGPLTSINLPGLGGEMINKYDDVKKGATTVIFMRHTRPEQGESCLFNDLTPGDVFHFPDDIITEYVKTGPRIFMCLSAPEAPLPHDSIGTVIFVRKQC